MGKALNKSRESAVVQCIANGLHQVQVVMQVVDGGGRPPRPFLALLSMLAIILEVPLLFLTTPQDGPSSNSELCEDNG